jgi:hypothetical protein
MAVRATGHGGTADGRAKLAVKASVPQINLGQLCFDFVLRELQFVAHDFGHCHGGQGEPFTLLFQNRDSSSKVADVTLSLTGRSLRIRRVTVGLFYTTCLKKFPQHDASPYEWQQSMVLKQKRRETLRSEHVARSETGHNLGHNFVVSVGDRTQLDVARSETGHNSGRDSAQG